MIYFLSRKTIHWLPKKVAPIIFQNENKGSVSWDITNYSFMILLMAQKVGCNFIIVLSVLN